MRNASIVTSSTVIENSYIVIKDGLIQELGREPYTGPISDAENLSGYIVIPGFIDTHVHGVEGLDITAKPDPWTFLKMSEKLAKYGVTGYLPTAVTAPDEILVEVCKAFKEAVEMWLPAQGARLFGLHLEGPYISVDARGAQDPEYIRKPNIKELSQYIRVSGNGIRQITVAPEIEGALDLIRYARANGITVSAGHTNASYQQGVDAIKAGVSKATHLFNGMRRVHHRDPGIAIALMESPQVYLELIVDLVHLHPAIVRMVINYAGPDRVVLVTDSIAATGMPDGIYELGKLRIEVRQGIARLEGKDTLAGSTLTMDRAFRNVIDLGYSASQASKMASLTPAKSIGLDYVGDIEPGYKADIVVLDREYKVIKTYINGIEVYSR